MGGRSAGSGFSDLSANLKDNTDFNAFVRDNMSNPKFMAFGRSEGMDAVEDLWRDVRTRSELRDLHEIPIEDAIDQVRSSIPSSVVDGWFRNADSGYKPALVNSILANKGTLNAGMNIAYKNYKDSTDNPVSFDKWLKTPQTMYRGTRGQQTVKQDIFDSYSPDKKVADSFGRNTSTIRVRPIDTWGSFQTTGEQEFLVPKRKLRK